MPSLVFLLYINELTNLSNVHFRTCVADYSNKFVSDENSDELVKTMNAEMIVDWLRNNERSLNLKIKQTTHFIRSTSMSSSRYHYGDVIMGAIPSQITSLTIVYSTVYSHADQRKHQSSASLAFVWEIHRGPVNFPHKWPVTRKMFPFDDVIMINALVGSR